MSAPVTAALTGPAGAAAPVAAHTKLVVDGVSKVFRSRRSSTTALEGVDLHVDEGELVCLLGASGCGKSTLLSIIGGLEEPTSGEVRVEGDRVIGPGADRGMVFQGYSLFPWLSVAGNIEFGLQVAHWSKARRAERVQELLGIMGLAEFRDSLPRELSGGMRQRVAIARALAPEPDILLLDEPFGALDAQTRRAMQDFLLTVWARTGTTVLMVTHDVEEAVYLSSRIYVMEARPGRVADVVDVPFGSQRGPSITRDPRFLDLRDELADLLA
ncbi:MAG: ABC transporter ATP-binding protein [Microthrixaceae bacterium]